MNVLIVRLGALGDIVHAMPAAAALRAAYPDARIDWLVDAKHRAIVDLVTSIDRVVALERRTLAGWTRRRAALRQVRYDCGDRFPGPDEVGGARARVRRAARGRVSRSGTCARRRARPFYTDAGESVRRTAIRISAPGHVIRKNLRLLRALGIDDDRIAFPLAATESPALASVRATLGGELPFALINPGAAWPNKRWPPERFGEVAAFLRDVRQLPSFVLWGPGEEGAGAGRGRRVGRRRAARAADEPRRFSRLSSRRADGVGRYRAAAHRGRGRHADALAVRADRPAIATVRGRRDDRVVSRYASCGCHYQRRCHQRVVVPGRRSRWPKSPPHLQQRLQRMTLSRAASRRLRVPIGFVCGALAFWLAQPTPRPSRSAAPSRSPARRSAIWAAGHLEKGREVTTSGPYAFTRHPLYLGSTLIGVGLGDRVGELDRRRAGGRVPGDHADRRDPHRGSAPDREVRRRVPGVSRRHATGVRRRFSLERAVRNREYRALVGLLLVLAIFAWKARTS